jgi:hypothetical protein
MPIERSRTDGWVAPGSASNATSTVVGDGERGSGTRFHRRVAASKRAATGTAGRGVADALVVVGGAGIGVGAVAEGVHEATTSPKVNTRARYLRFT